MAKEYTLSLRPEFEKNAYLMEKEKSPIPIIAYSLVENLLAIWGYDVFILPQKEKIKISTRDDKSLPKKLLQQLNTYFKILESDK